MSGLADIQYKNPLERLNRLWELGKFPYLRFDIICAVEARKFGVTETELRRLVMRVAELDADEFEQETAAMELMGTWY